MPETSDAIDASASEPSQAPGGASEREQQLAGYLYEAALSPRLLILGLGLSALLGRLHALTPGRRRTLVAAYLIGSRGTAKHAATLGGIVTVTHTASVIAVGLLAILTEAHATGFRHAFVSLLSCGYLSRPLGQLLSVRIGAAATD